MLSIKPVKVIGRKEIATELKFDLFPALASKASQCCQRKRINRTQFVNTQEQTKLTLNIYQDFQIEAALNLPILNRKIYF